MRNKLTLGLAVVVMSCLAYVGLAKKIEGGDDKLLRVLIIDGQNNHKWESTTPVMQDAFKSSGRYTVDVSTSPGKKGTEEEWGKWRPDFSKYDVVVSNYNGQMWPGEVRTAFVNFVKNGGGFVVVHAADNAFGMWPEYN
ncbi:MAG: trehalose utilization, partial [Verrucomicrobiaceae bacterium TMED86]